MKRPAGMLFTAWLAVAISGAGLDAATAGENAARVQALEKVAVSDLVKSAAWARSPDAYTLQLVLDWSKYSAKPRAVANSEQKAVVEPPAVVVAPPAPAATQGPAAAASPGPGSLDRSNFFIANTIANLRGLDPVFSCGRVLTLIDGRRRPAQPPPTPGKDQAYPPRMKESRVEVWLLKGDGTQILPNGYSCVSAPGSRDAEVLYKFPVDGGAQAVAAAIRIDDEFYIEKLQPLEPQPVGAAPGD